MNYFLHLLIFFNLYLILALSLNLIVGYCGLLTLAHSAYFAVGAYTYALATLKLGWGFLPALALGMTFALILSFAVSLPAWRLRGDFFVMLTLAVQTLIFSLCQNWFSPQAELGTWRNLTNGPLGISGVPKPTMLGSNFATIASIAALSCVLALLVCLISAPKAWRATTAWNND